MAGKCLPGRHKLIFINDKTVYDQKRKEDATVRVWKCAICGTFKTKTIGRKKRRG